MIIYLLVSLSLGWLGANKKFGFVGNFLCSIVFTPIVGFILLLAQHSNNE
jgi:hypothetical protein